MPSQQAGQAGSSIDVQKIAASLDIPALARQVDGAKAKLKRIEADAVVAREELATAQAALASASKTGTQQILRAMNADTVRAIIADPRRLKQLAAAIAPEG